MNDPYRSLFEDAPVAYHELDSSATIQRVNRAECQLLGYQAEEMLGRKIWDFIAGEEEEASQAAFRERLAGKKALEPFRRTYVTRSNSHVLVEIHERLIRNAAGEVVGIRSALIDVTERVAAERALVESRSCLQAVLSSIADAVIAFDTLGYVLVMNRSALDLLGGDDSRWMGHPIEEALTLSDIQTDTWSAPTFSSIFRKSLVQPWSGVASLGSPCADQRGEVSVCSTPMFSDGLHSTGAVLVFRTRA